MYNLAEGMSHASNMLAIKMLPESNLSQGNHIFYSLNPESNSSRIESFDHNVYIVIIDINIMKAVDIDLMYQKGDFSALYCEVPGKRLFHLFAH